MSSEREQLLRAIAALEAQRATLGDAVAETALAPLRERLAALKPATPQQRRHVTVLFGDLCDFTALTERMDAEDVNELINTVWLRLDAIILRNGGRIDKHIGDAVMALWGTGGAREDDAERAVRAALNLQAEMAAFQVDGHPLSMRVGVNTGPVLLGEVGTTGELTVMGDTVNTANRLERAAPEGGVLISHRTYRHVSGAFVAEALEPLQLKGKQEPLRVYRVTGARPRAFQRLDRGLEGVRSRLIGREEELRVLRHALLASREPGGRLITVTGEAGVGKSRLLREVEESGAGRESTLRLAGRASMEMRGQPHALLRNLFRAHLGLQEGEPPRVVRARLEEAFAEELGEGETSRARAHLAGQLLGFDLSHGPHLDGVPLDEQVTRARGLAALGEYLHSLLARAPAVLVLEDLHWADDSSLDLVERLAQLLARERLLILCTARPEFLERHPSWGRAHPAALQLALEPLSDEDSEQLVDELLSEMDVIPDTLRARLVTRAEGNPFFLEELVRMLIEEGAILIEPEGWQVKLSRLESLRIPPTLVGVLQARLDGLPERERGVLQRCAVVGRVFWEGAVVWLDEGESSPDGVRAALASLQERELVVERVDSTFAGAREYVFKTALLREVTYETVLKRERRGYHGRVAEWLLHQGAERLQEMLGLIAEHLMLAGQGARAATYLRRAGEEALLRFGTGEARSYIERALALMPPGDAAERYAALAIRERACGVLGERQTQRADLEEMEALAAAIGDERRRVEVALRRALYGLDVCDAALGMEAAKRAIAAAEELGDVLSEATAHLYWGRILRHHQGDFAGARPHFERSLALAESNRLEHLKVESLLNLGALQTEMGHFGAALPYDEQALALARAMGDKWLESTALRYLAYLHKSVGDFARAKAGFEQCLQLCRVVGYRLWECADLGNLALIAQRTGDDATAIERGGQALEIAEEIGSTRYKGYSWMVLGHALLGLGRVAESLEAYRQALRLREDAGMTHVVLESRAGIAGATLAQGDVRGAWEQVDTILRQLEYRNLNGSEEPVWIRLVCVRVLREARDPRLGEFLEAAHRDLEERKARIHDEGMRRSFSEIRTNRELEAEWKAGPGERG